MEGNPCGDYALSLKFPGNDSTDVCTEGNLYLGAMEENESLDIDLWFKKSAEFSLTCYLWCTKDGQFPRAPNDRSGSGDSSWFLALVR